MRRPLFQRARQPQMDPSSSGFFHISLITLKVSGMKKWVKISKKRTFSAVLVNLVVSEGLESAKNAPFYIVFTLSHLERHISEYNLNSNPIFETVIHERQTFRMKHTIWESDKICGDRGHCTGFFLLRRYLGWFRENFALLSLAWRCEKAKLKNLE